MINGRNNQNMTHTQRASRNANDQRGLVSFMVTLIMMIVITLIVIGFTQVTIRSRGEALDRQLSEQAFYAAESGVNQVVNAIKTSSGTVTPQPSCSGGGYTAAPIGSAPNAAVTCIIVDPVVDDIRFAANQQSSTVLKIEPEPANLTELNIKWATASGVSDDINNCGDYTNPMGALPKTIDADCGFGLLRLDLMHHVSGNDNVGVGEDLADSTVTYFFKPTLGGGVATTLSTGTPKANISNADCFNLEKMCTISIPIDPVTLSNQKFYARISTYYRDTQLVVIDGKSSLVNASFKDVQVLIDSTGKAADVLRRVQARYPTGITHSMVPPASLGSEVKICKRFTSSSAPQLFAMDSACAAP